MNPERKNYGSGAPWESRAGYSRLVRVGPFLEVAGTTAVSDGQVQFPGDAAGQARFILERIAVYLEKAGASLEDVVRTRMYLTNIEDWEAVTDVHGSFFGQIRPVSTLVAVSALVDPELLVEIEVSALKVQVDEAL